MAVERAVAGRQARLVRGTAVGAAALGALVAALATGAAGALGLDPLYVPKALAGFAFGAGLVLAFLPAHPFDRFGPANHVTLARVALVALLAGLLGETATAPVAAFAAATAGLAVALDFVDGRLARSTGLSSPYGARFDMETDAALILVLCALAWQLGKAGSWVLAAGLLRYGFVAAGRVAPWMRRPLPPSARRRFAAAVQMVALVVVLAVPAPASDAVAALALALLVHSFATDTLWLHRNREVPT